ncbi:MAG: DoxX family protein [Steroidobacteraceae bacterium]
MNRTVTLLARLLLAQVFLMAGLAKLGSGYAATQDYMQTMGVPGALLPLVILLEIGGGLTLIIGAFTRWTALVLAGYSVLAALIFHHNIADRTQMTLLLSDLAIVGGLLLLYAYGAGELSVDARRLGQQAAQLRAR